MKLGWLIEVAKSKGGSIELSGKTKSKRKGVGATEGRKAILMLAPWSFSASQEVETPKGVC